MNRRFLAIAADPRIIPGVHHYCDEWCDYCSVTSRCLGFRCTEDWRKQRRRPAGAPPFESMDEAVQFTRELSEVEGRGTEELDLLLAAPPGQSDIDTDDPLTTIAWEYALGATALLLSMPEDAADPGNGPRPAPIEVVVWYHLRIYMKLFRAFVARDRTAAGKAEKSEEALGCAKMALVAVERSRAALPALVLDGNQAHVARLQAMLEALETGIDQRLPRARTFIRIGLDVPAAA